MFELYFIVDDKDYAFRIWPGVPRVGDRVMMHPSPAPRKFIVEAICWGVREEEAKDRVTCNVMLREVEPE